MRIFILLLSLFAFSYTYSQDPIATRADEKVELTQQQFHPNPRMRFQVIQSHYVDLSLYWKPFEEALNRFESKRYEALKPLILESDIATLQYHINSRKFTYEELTLFYLCRIRRFESDPDRSLHVIISLNPKILEEAKACDRKPSKEPLYGMPVLVKDNINTASLPTTAGAVALMGNQTEEDAFIVKKLKKAGALILGKTNLSEWAYFFCENCPYGYSAVGGQSLNPYGRRKFESGGSSSGSAIAVAANYAVAALGTETAGSIISPSSQNSVVGMKPTVGLLSREGIIPISFTLDTPGPITKNVADNALLLQILSSSDTKDPATAEVTHDINYSSSLSKNDINGKRLGVLRNLMRSDTLYYKQMLNLKEAGAELVELSPAFPELTGFLSVLSWDMLHDLPVYLNEYVTDGRNIKGIDDIIAFNLKDKKHRAPYGQARFEVMVKDNRSTEEVATIKDRLRAEGDSFFDKILIDNQLDALLTVNNTFSVLAAVAFRPCLSIPMGYRRTEEPAGLTIIGAYEGEKKLYEVASAIEKVLKARRTPGYYP